MTRARLLAAIAIPISLLSALVLVLINSSGSNNRPLMPATIATTATSNLQTTTRSGSSAFDGEDWKGIVGQIINYRDSLYKNPRPELLENIYDKRCPCYAKEYREIMRLKQHGLSYKGSRTRITHINFYGRGTETPKERVVVEVFLRTDPYSIVDKNGRVVEHKQGSQVTRYLYQLDLGKDKRWRVFFIL